MELSKKAQAEERLVCQEEEFWETVHNRQPDRTLEREILLTYCEMLTPNQQKWIVYTFWDGLSIKEIAELEKVTVSAVKQWRTGAREKHDKNFFHFIYLYFNGNKLSFPVKERAGIPRVDYLLHITTVLVYHFNCSYPHAPKGKI